MGNLNTAMLQVLNSFLYGNVQQSKLTPPALPVLNDQSPTSVVQEMLLLPAAGASVPLPVPPNWTQVTQAVLVNADTAGYCVVQKKGGGALVGGTATTAASRSMTAIASAAGKPITFSNIALGTGDSIVVNGIAFSGSSPAYSGYQFALSPTLSTQLAFIASTVNGFSGQTGVSVSSTGTDLIFTAASPGVLGNMTSIAWNFSAQLGAPYQGQVIPGTLDQVLAPNGGVLAQSFAGLGPAGENTTVPSLWTLRSCDLNGVLANGLATQVYCYLTGY